MRRLSFAEVLKSKEQETTVCRSVPQPGYGSTQDTLTGSQNRDLNESPKRVRIETPRRNLNESPEARNKITGSPSLGESAMNSTNEFILTESPKSEHNTLSNLTRGKDRNESRLVLDQLEINISSEVVENNGKDDLPVGPTDEKEDDIGVDLICDKVKDTNEGEDDELEESGEEKTGRTPGKDNHFLSGKVGNLNPCQQDYLASFSISLLLIFFPSHL